MNPETAIQNNTELEELIVCAGHAAFSSEFIPEDIEAYPFDTTLGKWVLQSFQEGEPPYYGEHTRRALELLSDSSKTLLIFSGGFTRPQSVGNRHNWSEAASYHTAAERSGWLTTNTLETVSFETDAGEVAIPLGGAQLEGGIRKFAYNEYARDSIENVMGDIISFRLLTGKYPKKVTVVGWEFKRKRFEDHSTALKIPQAIFNYVGVNNPADIHGAEIGEMKAIKQFEEDPFGDHFEGREAEEPSSLAGKRISRDPLNRGNPHWDMYHREVLDAANSPWSSEL